MIGNSDDRLLEEIGKLVATAHARAELANFDVMWKEMCAIIETAGFRLQCQQIRIVGKRLTAAFDVVDPMNLPPANLEQPDHL